MFFTLALLACTSGDPAVDSGALEVPIGDRGACDPVDPGHCMLPFPSDFQAVEDPATPTGLRVSLAEEALPVSINDVAVDPFFWNELDGWSTLTPIMAHLPDASLAGLPTWETLETHLDADVRSVILDSETGQRVPHYAERAAFPDDPDRAVLTLRPVAPMVPGRTYVVALRDLQDDSGAAVAAPDGFAALRDGTLTGADDPDLRRQVERFESVVFPTVEAAGWSRDELTLAWSFTTASKEGTTGRSVWMRDQALSWAEARWAEDPAGAYVLDPVEEGSCADGGTIARTLTGTFTAPLYLESDEPGSVLTRDADGWPTQNGTTEVPFTLRVPCSVAQGGDDGAPQPGGLIQFGHGLLSDQGDVRSGSLARLANGHGALLGAVDWIGMATGDRSAVTLMISENPGRFSMIPERVMQSYVHHALFTRLVQGPLSQDALLTESGTSLVDPDADVIFYGISQGAVIGGGFAALSTDVDKVLLGTPGAPFTILLERSTGFTPFLMILEALYEDPVEVSLIIAMMQSLWDPGESAGYARYLNGEPLDEVTPPKEALMFAGLGDALVPALGAHVMARSYGAGLLSPAPRDVWGLETAEEIEGSALLELDFGYDLPAEPVPADPDNSVHWSVTSRSPVEAMILDWLETGVARSHCDGVCDPD